ncbi:MAG: CBS domain-containing protein [Planctomycetes bacterium]|jgi:CBS domain-containing protein|nr:CBS domain-containing protein [Planctomycetota bacterium]
MQAKELMAREPRAVRLHERLDAAARVMWEQDCGFCPVLDSTGVLIGVLTDRDLCMAAYTQGKALFELPVTAAMARSVRTVRAEDTVQAVLAVMQQAQVHRAPVVDARGMLVGIISTNDLVRAAANRPAAIDANLVIKALATIGAPRALAVPATATASAVATPRPAAPAEVAKVRSETVASVATAVAANAAPASPVVTTQAPKAPVVAPAPVPAATASKGKKPVEKPKSKPKGKKG